MLFLTLDESDAMSTDELVEEVSEDGFLPTLQRLRSVIASAGMTVFAEIDHAAAAIEVGLHMPPTVVLLYGNPKAGTPVMLSSPPAALELPLRVLLSEDAGGRVRMRYHPIAAQLARLGVDKDVANRLGGAQTLLLKAMRP